MVLNRRKKLSIIALSLFLLAGTGSVVLIQQLPSLVNTDELKQSIEKGLHDSTGVNFKIKKLNLKPTLLHGIQVDLNTTDITDMQHHPLGDIGYITIQIRYLPIIVEQLPEISKIHIRQVNIPIGKYSLFKEVKLKLVKPKRTGFLKPAELKNTEILLSDYRIEDEAVSEEVDKLLVSIKKPVKHFHVVGESISVKHVESKKPIEIKGAGLLSFLQSNQKIAVPSAHYEVDMAIPQEVVKAKNPRYTDLTLLNFDLTGKNVNFKLRYKRRPHGNGNGSFHSDWFDLMQGQIFVLQLGDTFGFALPKIVTETYVAGLGKMNSKFQLRFAKARKKGKNTATAPVVPEILAQGEAELKDVSAARRPVWPQTLVNRMTGKLSLLGETFETKNLTLNIGELPLTLKGGIKINSEQVDLQAETFKANLGTVKQTLAEGGIPIQPLENRNLQGTLDFIGRIKGKLENPSYIGLLWLKNGSYDDKALGLSVSGLTGTARFNGNGTKNLQYNGEIELSHANIDTNIDKSNEISLQDLRGIAKLKGRVVSGKPPEIPKTDGWLEVGDGTYTQQDTGLKLTRIHGKLLMEPSQYQLPKLQANLGDALFNASGKSSPDFKQYQLNVTSHNINIPRLKKEFPAKLLAQAPWMKQGMNLINPTSGTANLDLAVSTGAKMNGQLTVSGVTVQTGHAQTDTAAFPLRIPRLSVLFTDHRIVVKPATIYYGDAEANLQGQFQQGGTYQFTVHTGEVPVAMIRDSIGFINAITAAHIPEIWNTEGSVQLDSMLSNRVSNLKVGFNNAGLSWQGGDFPVYDINGHLFYKRVGNGEDFMGTRDLSFYYGNSPISIKAGSSDHFRMRTEGTFSALLVNHFLVSSQSNATPYREIPFSVRAAGVLEGLPGSKDSIKNKIATSIHLDLNPTIKDAYKDQLSTPSHLQPAEAPQAPASAPPGHNTAATANNPATPPRKRRAKRHHDPQNLLSRIQEKVQEGLQRFAPQLAKKDEHEGEETTPASNQKSNEPTVANAPSSQTASVPEAKASDRVYNTPKTASETYPSSVRTNTVEQASLPEPSLSPSRSPETVYSVAQNLQPTSIQQSRVTQTPEDTDTSTQTSDNDDNAYLDFRLMLSGNDLLIQKGQLHLFEAGNLLAEGAVQNLFDSQKRLFGIHAYTQPEISLDKLSHSSRDNDFYRNASGQFALDIRFTGGEKLDSIEGWSEAKQIVIPYLTINDFSGRIDFPGGENAKAEITSFKVPGVEAMASATTDSLFEFPITLDNVKISGGILSLDSLEQFSNAIVTPLVIEQLVHNFTRPWQQGDPRIPIQFKDADLHFDEAILQNIIMRNLNSKLSVYANSFFELTNTTLEAAGGKINGYFSMNPNENNFMTLELNADNVKANALTRALLGVTNQVFGDLSGTVRFTTFGLTDVEMQDNANGTVHMRVTNGRLPAIAKVETLLATANLLRGGILGFNLNNLFRSLTFYDTNYFAELSGDLLIAKGVLYTDNLISDGVNLDLVIQGSLDMGSGDANMLVNGRMSQDVTGKLGALGKLSLGSVLRYVPGIGTLGPNQPGLLGYLPGVGFVPGFGGPAGDFNYFQVRLLGQLDDPSAIQDFHWVHKAK